MFRQVLAVEIVVLVLLQACAGYAPGIEPVSTPGGPESSKDRGHVSTTIPEGIMGTETDEGRNPHWRAIDHAAEDLSNRLGIEKELIQVVLVESVIWPDRSLGCPRPGMIYPQVQQDGIHIVLQAQGRDYHYHGGGARFPFLCDSPQLPPDGTVIPNSSQQGE